MLRVPTSNVTKSVQASFSSQFLVSVIRSRALDLCGYALCARTFCFCQICSENRLQRQQFCPWNSSQTCNSLLNCIWVFHLSLYLDLELHYLKEFADSNILKIRHRSKECVNENTGFPDNMTPMGIAKSVILTSDFHCKKVLVYKNNCHVKWLSYYPGSYYPGAL